MKRSKLMGFTLVELLVVISMIVVLVAMLMPATQSVWQVLDATRCKANLAMIYRAQGVWTADRLSNVQTDSSSILGDAWAGSVLSYLENRGSALMCPSSEITALAKRSHTDNASSTPSDPQEAPEEGQIGLDDITIGVTDAAGHVMYEISLGPNKYWTMYQSWKDSSGRQHIGANIDNYLAQDPATGRYTDEDFQFFVTYRNGQPAELIIGDCDGNGNQYYTDLRINRKPIWGGQRFLLRFAEGHVGEKIDLTKYTKLASSSTWTMWSGAPGVLGMTNYGISRGCFQDKNGDDLHAPDSRLFFILDYPRSIADFTDTNDDRAVPDKQYWSQIFIYPTPPTNWSPPPELDGWTWQEVQALRHMGKANVLFCDGRIEALGPEELSATSPLWRYGAR